MKQTLTAMAIALAALTAGQPGTAQAEGKLIVSSPQDPGSWDPIDTFLVNWASLATMSSRD